jgi:RNA polymerase sigma-70 factor (ECF subfamily)
MLRNGPPFPPVQVKVRDQLVETGLESGLESVFRGQAPRLWRSLLLATGSREVADDAVAEAFAQALRRGEELRDPTAWIWRVAFRVARGEIQRQKTLTELSDDIAHDMPESLIDVFRALARLTPHQRTAVVLADYAGYPHRHIARLLDSSVSAVGVHLYRGRKRLRELLEEDRDA